MSRHPLFQVMLAFQNAGMPGLDMPGLTVVSQPMSTGVAKFDLALILTESRLTQGMSAGIEGTIEYSTDLFERKTVEAIATRLVRLFESAIAASRSADWRNRHSRRGGAGQGAGGVE